VHVFLKGEGHGEEGEEEGRKEEKEVARLSPVISSRGSLWGDPTRLTDLPAFSGRRGPAQRRPM
jgi:hypothetical protein